jgi:hypothetical protein
MTDSYMKAFLFDGRSYVLAADAKRMQDRIESQMQLIGASGEAIGTMLARIEELEAALLDEITKAYVRGGKWAFANGASFAEYLDKAANDYADSRSALGEKKDA